MSLMVPNVFTFIGFSCRFCIPYTARERKGLRHRVRWTIPSPEDLQGIHKDKVYLIIGIKSF
jgi:hypothetical protein